MMGVMIPDGETAGRLETAAREKAWLDFLSQIRFSLEVWQIDADVREHCEPVVAWLRRLAAELTTLGQPPDSSTTSGRSEA